MIGRKLSTPIFSLKKKENNIFSDLNFQKVPGGLVSIFLESKLTGAGSQFEGCYYEQAISVPQSPPYYRQKLEGRQAPQLPTAS